MCNTVFENSWLVVQVSGSFVYVFVFGGCALFSKFCIRSGVFYSSVEEHLLGLKSPSDLLHLLGGIKDVLVWHDGAYTSLTDDLLFSLLYRLGDNNA